MLPASFYARPVLDVARDLLGCTVEHRGAAGVIVETEAYHESEPACHAFVGRTARTETLFGEPGRAYVYRSYGIHALLNAVCEPEGIGAAVLIRALAPLDGVHAMRARRRATAVTANGGGRFTAGGGADRSRARRMLREEDLCSGPGKLTQALAVRLGANGSSLSSGPVRVLPRAGDWREPPVVEGTRIGITRATELPWRFCVAGNPNVSRPRPGGQRGGLVPPQSSR
jgi:DNA-3-methyladenine glycosylase